MNVNRTLTIYVGRQFLVGFLGLLLFFVIVLQMLDLLNKSNEIVEKAGGGWASVWRYVCLRAPEIANQFTPFAALLATVLTLSQMNLRSEVTVMRSAGLSVNRVLLPIGIMCGAVAFAHFAFQELVVVRASQQLAYWEANDFAPNLKPDDGSRTNVILAFGDEFIRAEVAARDAGMVRLNDVTISLLDKRGLLVAKTEAERAEYARGAWTLIGVRSFDSRTSRVADAAAQPWNTDLKPEYLFALSLDPDRTQLATLASKIRQLDAEHADTRAATTSFLGRFSRPMATLAMPLLGAIAGFGVTRQGNQLARAATGGALGFSYFVAENLMLALGKLGVAPAVLGAFFPFALFMVVGFAIILAMEA